MKNNKTTKKVTKPVVKTPAKPIAKKSVAAPKKVPAKKPVAKKVIKPKTPNQITIGEIKKLYKKLETVNATKVAILSEIAKKETEISEKFDYVVAKLQDQEELSQQTQTVAYETSMPSPNGLNAIAVKY